MAKPSKSLVRTCQLLRGRIRFTNASFRLPDHENEGFKHDEKDTADIREATRLYMQSWVEPILDAIERGDTAALKTFSVDSQGHFVQMRKDD